MYNTASCCQLLEPLLAMHPKAAMGELIADRSMCQSARYASSKLLRLKTLTAQQGSLQQRAACSCVLPDHTRLADIPSILLDVVHIIPSHNDGLVHLCGLDNA